MSKNKKYKKHKSRGFPLPLLVFGGILLIVAAFLYARQGGGGTPSISVDQQRIDYGDVKFNAPRSFTIKVTNTGDGTLRFKEKPYIQVMEGC